MIKILLGLFITTNANIIHYHMYGDSIPTHLENQLPPQILDSINRNLEGEGVPTHGSVLPDESDEQRRLEEEKPLTNGEDFVRRLDVQNSPMEDRKMEQIPQIPMKHMYMMYQGMGRKLGLSPAECD